MQPGEKIGDGGVSEVFAYGEGRILKLFNSGIRKVVADHEVRVTAAAHDAGAPAPEVFGVEEIDGRFGIILPRYDGPTLLTVVVRDGMSATEAGGMLARLHHSLHAARYDAAVPTFRAWALRSLERLRRKDIPEDVLERVESVVMGLPEAGVLCHGDLHVDNILMTSSGPVIIDWVSALSAEPALDVARQHLTLTVLPFDVEYQKLRLDLDAEFMRHYAEITGVTQKELVAAIAPYMTVMAAMRMNEGGSGKAERALLVEYIRSQ
jgi:aminoglycoside phosphotransferase (APT) family kinase protein